MATIKIVDPLTLYGREAIRLLEDAGPLAASLSYCHTETDEEHQITEVGGEPGLVPPLEDPAELADVDAVLIASPCDSPRSAHVQEFLEANPSTPVVGLGPSASLVELLVPAAGPPADSTERHLRVPHPALVVLHQLTSCLRYLEPESATVAAVDPVSVGGRDSVEQLARQAFQRLQGSGVDELIDDQVLAFTAIAGHDDDLNRDAAILHPGLAVAATRTYAGRFHGNVAHIGVVFAQPPESEHEVYEAFRDDERFAEPNLPLLLDASTDTNHIALSLPRLSGNDRVLAITAMVDGLRVGGVLTGIEILRSMLL